MGGLADDQAAPASWLKEPAGTQEDVSFPHRQRDGRRVACRGRQTDQLRRQVCAGGRGKMGGRIAGDLRTGAENQDTRDQVPAAEVRFRMQPPFFEETPFFFIARGSAGSAPLGRPQALPGVSPGEIKQHPLAYRRMRQWSKTPVRPCARRGGRRAGDRES